MLPETFWDLSLPQKLKEAVADGMRSIFYTSSREKARELFAEFKAKCEVQLPSAVGCLEQSLDARLTFFNFPEGEWISPRAQRLNKEFKRRTKPMEVVAGGVFLFPHRLHCCQNGTSPEVKIDRETGEKPTSLEAFGAAKNLHKTLDTGMFADYLFVISFKRRPVSTESSRCFSSKSEC